MTNRKTFETASSADLRRLALASRLNFERRQPHRAPSLAADFIVPFAQSVVCGIIGGVAGVLIVGGWTSFGVGTGLAFAGSWIILLRASHASLWVIESVTGRDLDADGFAGPPPVDPQPPVSVELVRNEGRQRNYVDLPISTRKLADVARACVLNDATFSRPSLCEERGILSQSEYHKLATAMVAAGLVVDLPGNRRELSAAGRALLRRIHEQEMG